MRFLLIFILIFVIKPLWAQNDSIECLKQISVYRELYKLNYKQQAYAHWQKSFQSQRTNRQRLCTDGEKYLAEQIQIRENKAPLADSMVLVYEELKQYTSNKALISLKQAITLYNYGEKTAKNIHLTQKNFESAFITFAEKYPVQAIAPYYYTLEKQLELESISPQEFYRQAIPLITFSAKNTKKELISEPEADFAKQTFKFDQEFLDFLAKLSIVEQATIIHQIGIAYFSLKTGNAKWLSDWLEIIPEDSLKTLSAETLSEIYFLQAGVYFESGKLAEAKSAALQSNLYKANELSYLLLGEIYIRAAAQNPEIYEPAIYCLAADQFSKAAQINPAIKDSADKKIKWLQQYFPSQEDAFFKGIKNNSVYQLGSWINESTTIRFRETTIN